METSNKNTSLIHTHTWLGELVDYQVASDVNVNKIHSD